MSFSSSNGTKRSPLKKYVFVLGSAATLVGRAGAQTAAQFTFESNNSTASTTAATSGMLTAEVGLGTAVGVHALATTVYSFPLGYGSGIAFSSNHWTAGDYYQFSINAASFTSAYVSFDMARSGTGPAGFILQYSTDGSTFTNFTTFTASSVTFATTGQNAANLYNFDFSGITALSNNANDAFRLVSDGTNSSGGTSLSTAGTDRVDNFQFGPAQVVVAAPEPSALALVSIAGAAAAMAVRRRQRA